MTIEEVKKILDNTKVRVNGKSEEIQKKLFSFGYKWRFGENKVKLTEKPFLFINDDGVITHSNDSDFFNRQEETEITAEQILSLELTKEYRPFKDRDECWKEMQQHQPFGWICRNSKYCQILGVSDNGIRLPDLFCTFEQAADCIFPDGTPFGIKE